MEESSKTPTIILYPTLSFHNRDGELELQPQHQNSPDLRINEQYAAEMLRGYRDNLRDKNQPEKTKEAILFIKQKLILPEWFIDAIKQRQGYPYCTMYAIMQFQYDYFLTGDERESKAYDPKRHCRRSPELRYISYRFKGSNSKFVPNRIWYQTPERLFLWVYVNLRRQWGVYCK